jgi:hypothetical protein
MAMWAMLASPLMIGADVRNMAPEYRQVHTHFAAACEL